MWDTVVLIDPQNRHDQSADLLQSNPPPLPGFRVQKLRKRISRIDRRIDRLNHIYRALENALHASTAIGPNELIHLPEGLGSPGGFKAVNAVDLRCLSRLKILWRKYSRDAACRKFRILMQKLRRMRLFCRSEVEAAMQKLIDQIQILERIQDRLHQELFRFRQDRITTQVLPVPLSA